MYHIIRIFSFSRSKRLLFSTTKHLSAKSLKTTNNETNNVVQNEHLSPLYTQKIGLFSKPGITFREDSSSRFRTYTLYIFSLISFVVIVAMIKIIPPGHIGILVRKDGKIDQFNNKGRLALFHIPFVEKPIAFRVTPIRKKIVRSCETLDGKKLEVVVFLTLTAKVPFVSHIYSIFGVNYSKSFVEKELNFDIDQVIKKFNLDDLILSTGPIETLQLESGNVYRVNSKIEEANEEIVQRFEDAGVFNKITVSDIVSLDLPINFSEY